MKPLVTEQTAKRFKGLMVVGIVLTVVGILVAMASKSSSVGLLIMSAGAATYLYARFAAWWNHG